MVVWERRRESVRVRERFGDTEKGEETWGEEKKKRVKPGRVGR